MKMLTWSGVTLVAGMIAAAACSDGRSGSNVRGETSPPMRESAAANPEPVPITVTGCLQQSASNDFIVTTVNEPTRSVATSGDLPSADHSKGNVDSPQAGVVERQQLRSAAGAYQVDPANGMNLKALVGKEVRITGVIKDKSDLPRADGSHDRVSITEDELTRMAASAVTTIADVCSSDHPKARSKKAKARSVGASQ